jgi:hypothetical protein
MCCCVFVFVFVISNKNLFFFHSPFLQKRSDLKPKICLFPLGSLLEKQEL